MLFGRLIPATATLLAAFAFSAGSLACASDGNAYGRADATAGMPGEPTRGQPATSSARQATSSARPRARRVGNFRQPVEIKSAPGFPRLMFVVEQGGRIMVMRRGRKLARPFLNISRWVSHGSEQGLLSVAFPRDYRRTRRFYVYFTDRRGDIRVFEFRRRTPARARHNSARQVIRIPHPEHSNHNGGTMNFLGNHLYFSTGDGGGYGDPAGNAQNLNSLLGKLIRIDPRRRGRRPYTIPAANPFAGRNGRDEIFAYGLRNPFRWSFDINRKRRARIAIGDVGQDEFEEINYLNLRRARGGNFGWNLWEGFSEFNGGGGGTIKPSLVLANPPNCSVVGGLVVRDRRLPALRGRYVFADFCTGKVHSFRPNLGRTGFRDTGLRIDRVTSFGQSRRGALFVTTLAGPVYRVLQ